MDLLKYYNIPYKVDGRSFNGADCYGFLMLFYKNELGIDIFDYKFQPNDVSIQHELAVLYESFTKVDTVSKFDILLFQRPSGMHCGIALNSRQFIHLTEKPGCTVGNISTWLRHMIGIYRYKETPNDCKKD